MNKEFKRIIIYPSYSMRDYKTNVYLLNSDAEFNQMIIEAKILTKYFEEVFLIIPNENQRKLGMERIPDGIQIIEKKYEYNVGTERYSENDKEFFKKIIDDNTVLYSNFPHKWKYFDEIGIPSENILYTFWHFYPDFEGKHYMPMKKNLGIIFRSEKQKTVFEKKTILNESWYYVLKSHHGLESIRNSKFSDNKVPSLVIPTRFDHEDFNHTWEALSIALALKNDLKSKFKLILCNPNNSGNLSHLINIADEIGPIPKERFEDILKNEQGVIFVKKETDYGGTKGAPEYLSSNLIFISNDYNINPYDIQGNDNTIFYSYIKRLLTIEREEYYRIKNLQKKICEKHHGTKNIYKLFDKIFNKNIGEKFDSNR